MEFDETNPLSSCDRRESREPQGVPGFLSVIPSLPRDMVPAPIELGSRLVGEPVE
jgi:hypothetical protein